MDRGDTVTRYARQITVPEVGQGGQSKLARARILVVGAGGLAATVLPQLAGAGVGAITLADDDHISLSNLHRQTLFTEADIGLRKVDVAAQRLRAINGDISITAVPARLTPATMPAHIEAADLVIDCADSFAASYALSDLCNRTPLITASVLGLDAYIAGVCGGGPSLRAVLPGPPQNAESCASAGVLGPIVAIAGAFQAQMALAVILGFRPSPLGRLVQITGAGLHLGGFRFDAASEPADHFAFIDPGQMGPGDQLIDLTTTKVDEITPPAANKRLVLACDSGLRAWRAAEQISQTWPGSIALIAAATS